MTSDREGKEKPKRLGSHQKCWLWGRHVVLETLRAGKWPILELYLADHLPPAEQMEVEATARKIGVPVLVESAAKLTRKCHSEEHQGFLAKMAEFPYDSAAAILQPQPHPPLYAVIDSIQDPYNFGAIIRSAEGFGLDAVFIGASHQVGVTSHVARSSSGAVNRIPIAREEDLLHLCERLRERGVALVGSNEKAGQSIEKIDFTRPAAILIGNEGQGIREELAQSCSVIARIPQHGTIGSLNAAAAAAVFFYEARRQRRMKR